LATLHGFYPENGIRLSRLIKHYEI